MRMVPLVGKKILVTGSHGFLGRAIVRTLLARGVPMASLVLPRSADCDLRVKADCERAVEGADIVIHAAAISGNGAFHASRPAEILHDNALMALQLMDAAHRAGVKKFVGIGSATEYPESVAFPLREDDLLTGPPAAGHAAYSTAKRLMFAAGDAYRAQYGLCAVHLMPANMYGAGEGRDTYVIPALFKKIITAKKAGAESLTMFGTGRETREFLYVDDAAEAVVLAAEKYEGAEPVNLGTGVETSIAELVERIIALTEFAGKVVWGGETSGLGVRRVFDVSRAERVFGFRAKTGIADGLRKTFESLTF